MKALALVLPFLAVTSATASRYPAIAHGPDLAVEYFDYRDFHWAAGRGGYSISFHVDAAVKNLAYEKRVGAVWTADGWVTTLTCDLAYEGPLDAGYERWGADCRYPIVATTGAVDFALFATMGGTTYWDNGGGKNLRLGYGHALLPSPQTGIGVRNDGVFVSASGARAVGLAEVWPYDGARSVTVVYTTDHWATTQTYAAALNADGTYSWDIPLPASASTVELAVSYDVLGMTFWANNGGANYVDVVPR